MNRTTAFTLALLLLTPALAGGAGPNVARPAGTTLNPFGTSSPSTLPVTLADLLRPGSVLTLVTARNVNAGQVRGPTVLLAATSEPAIGVVVSRGNEQLRYTFRTPLRAGQSKTVGSVVLLPVPPAVLLPSQAPLPAPLVTPVVTPSRPVATPVSPVVPPAAPTVRPAPTPPGATPPVATPPIATPPVSAPPLVMPPVGTVDEPISICHATGSASNPYNLITVSRSALGAHEGHGDIIPAPAEGCPISADASAPTPPSPTPPTPTPPDQTPPAPTPPAPPENGNDKVDICHATGSASNPYNLISVSRDALGAHEGHGDLIPAPAGGCPTSTGENPTPPDQNPPAPTPPSPTPPTPTPPSQTPPAPTPPAPPENGNDKVDICHATGSASNPYNLISVSRDALGAHEGHGDLIPAPAGGCPAGTPPGNNK